MDYPRYYEEMTTEELDGLDRDKTVFIMVLSPLEAHGPHLPLGTDLFLGEEIQKMMVEILQEEYPEYLPVILPPLTLGSDALPRPGSIGLRGDTLSRVLREYAQGLLGMGFKYLLLADNHGGPRHLLACEKASRRLYRRYGFYLLNPFISEFRLMLSGEEEFFRQTGLKAGECGDLSDLHAGTNETSLMLAAGEDRVREGYRRLPPSAPPRAGGLFRFLSRLFSLLGQESLGRELRELGSIAAWAADESLPAYIGAPAGAKAASGRKVFAFRKNMARSLIARALQGKRVYQRPPLWPLKILLRLP